MLQQSLTRARERKRERERFTLLKLCLEQAVSFHYVSGTVFKCRGHSGGGHGAGVKDLPPPHPHTSHKGALFQIKRYDSM